MEEKIGKRINVERVDEALGTAPSKIATGCPFCRVMLTDGVTSRQSDGMASEKVEVVDVAQLLLTAVKRKPEPALVASGAPSLDESDAELSAKPDVPTDEKPTGTPLPEGDD